MFNMGGRINQAAGTGITSGLDTPKRGLVDGPGGYAGRTADEIEAEILKLYPEKTANQRGFDILESYGSLPSARKDGVYRTIGERLDMRSESFEKKLAEETALKNKARLTILEADQAKNLADELAANALERAKVTARTGIANEKTKNRQLTEGYEKLAALANETTFPGRSFVLDGNIQNIVLGEFKIRQLQAEGEGSNARVIPNTAYKRGSNIKDKKGNNAGSWDFVMANLSPGVVYWDSSRNKWTVITQDDKGKKYPKFFTDYNAASATLSQDSSDGSSVSAISTENNPPIKVEKTDGIQTVSLHPVKEGSDEVTDEYVLQYIKDNNIITDSVEYKAKEDKENYTLLSINQVKARLKKENRDTVRQEEQDQKTYARKEREALNWFTRNYERYKDGKVQMPDRFQEFEEVYLGTLAVKVAEAPEKLAAGGRAGYAMGSPEFQGEVVTEELEEIEPDSGVDELADLQTWWKSEIEKDFNS